MLEALEVLRHETVPKPGCPGTRVDEDGREWYSAGWIDCHVEDLESYQAERSTFEASK